MKKYAFYPHSPKYKQYFNEEKRRLIKILGNSAKIEHVGSTAIPGLGGKGIIDVTVGVKKKNISRTKQLLERAGYEFREKASTPPRLFFRRLCPYPWGKQWLHVHLTPYGGRDWGEMIGFRDYLRKHPEAAEDYVGFKKEALKKARGKGEIYRRYKETFIKNVLKKAMVERRKSA